METEEGIGHGLLHVAAEFEIELRVRRDFDVEVTIAALDAFVDGLPGFFQVARVDGPKSDGVSCKNALLLLKLERS
jgi:hypothetical protein